MRSAGSELVFEVMIVSGRTSSSVCAKILRLSARSSVAASSHPVGLPRDRIVQRCVQVLRDPPRPGLAHLAALDRFLSIVFEALDRVVKWRLSDVHEMQRQLGDGALEVIADVGTDGTRPDHHHAPGQSTRRFVQQWIGVGHYSPIRIGGGAVAALLRP